MTRAIVLGGLLAIGAVAGDRHPGRVDDHEREPGQQLGELIVAMAAVSPRPPQVGVDQRAAEHGVDPAVGRLARIRRIDPGVSDHQPDLIVLQQEVADPADRVGAADSLVGRADPLGTGVRRSGSSSPVPTTTSCRSSACAWRRRFRI